MSSILWLSGSPVDVQLVPGGGYRLKPCRSHLNRPQTRHRPLGVLVHLAAGRAWLPEPG